MWNQRIIKKNVRLSFVKNFLIRRNIPERTQQAQKSCALTDPDLQHWLRLQKILTLRRYGVLTIAECWNESPPPPQLITVCVCT
jgi:hypothetical protein